MYLSSSTEFNVEQIVPRKEELIANLENKGYTVETETTVFDAAGFESLATDGILYLNHDNN